MTFSRESVFARGVDDAHPAIMHIEKMVNQMVYGTLIKIYFFTSTNGPVAWGVAGEFLGFQDTNGFTQANPGNRPKSLSQLAIVAPCS